MIHFVVVSGTPGAVQRAREKLGPALDATRYFDGSPRSMEPASGGWAASCIAASDPMLSSRMVCEHDALVVMNGPVLGPPGSEPFDLRRHLLGPFVATGAVPPDLSGGSFNFIGISPSTGVSAYTDLSGLFPLYYSESADLLIVSNRSSTVAHVSGSASHDLDSLAWLIGHGNLFGHVMPQRGVRYLAPGNRIEAPWEGSRATFSRSPEWIWPEAGSPADRDDLTAAEWDEVTASLVDDMTRLRRWGGRIHLALSGGKDSRVCLAVALAAGLGDIVDTYTMGAIDNPEVEVAAEVARVAGLSHERRGSQVMRGDAQRQPALDTGAIWSRLRQHAYRYDGILSPWDGTNEKLRGTRVDIQGFGGDLVRMGHGPQFRTNRPATVDELVPLFYDYHQVHDPLGILRRDQVARQRSWLEGWVRDTARDVRLDAISDKFYVDFRVGHWNGPMGQAKPGRITVNPLLSRFAVEKALELSPSARSANRFHFEVMRRAAPELVTIPFLRDTWPEAVRATSPLDLPAHPFATTVTPTAHTLTGWQFPFLKAEKKTIRRLFREAGRHTEMGSICDLRKLRHVDLDAEVFPVAHARTVLSCISIALTLLGRSEQVVDELAGGTASSTAYSGSQSS